MTRVLISGFEPFGGECLNPTSEILKELEWLTAIDPSGVVQIETVVLPVRFQDAYQRLAHTIATTDPELVIALGQAGGRAKIGLERVAINCIDSDVADNAGAKPTDCSIVSGAPAGLFVTLPLRAMLEAGRATGVDCEISNSAGTYVCNFVLYRLLEENRFSRRRCGFIHVPYLPEQVAARTPRPPSMRLSEMKTALTAIVAAAVRS